MERSLHEIQTTVLNHDLLDRRPQRFNVSRELAKAALRAVTHDLVHAALLSEFNIWRHEEFVSDSLPLRAASENEGHVAPYDRKDLAGTVMRYVHDRMRLASP